MDYKRIHDSIIDRALSRSLSENIYYENHHIHPKCEGGDPNGITVKLTFKEHRIVHKLRYKFTGVVGNICAYNMMSLGDGGRVLNVKLAARESHRGGKLRDPEKYFKKQGLAGKNGGLSAYKNTKGFHKFSEDQKQEYRTKGRETIVKNKIGMFSDEYREIHRYKMRKIIEIDGNIFNSCTEAAKYYEVSNALVSYWIKENKAKILFEGEYSFKGKGEKT